MKDIDISDRYLRYICVTFQGTLFLCVEIVTEIYFKKRSKF